MDGGERIVSQPEYRQLLPIFQHYLSVIRPSERRPSANYEETPFRGAGNLRVAGNDAVVMDYDAHKFKEVYWLYGSIYIEIDASNGEILALTNIPVMDAVEKLKSMKVDENYVYPVPELSFREAVKKAHGFLDSLGVLIPNDFGLGKVDFLPRLHEWEVRWQRYVGIYPFDDFMDVTDAQDIAVIFQEDLGLVAFGKRNYLPAPKSVEVKVDRETAIVKASRCVALVEKTPEYLSARVPGFIATRLKDATLKVAVPNWLLDPARADWLRTREAKETRLCWVITFGTEKSGAEQVKLKLIEPDILIYIDAATGEVVGANFS